MPESYVDKLANSDIVTVNHLLPSVTRRIAWPEQDRDVILVGTRGEVPIMHRGLKKPMLEAVAPGKIVVGYDIHKDLGLSEGDTLALMGREFTVSTLHPQRGSEDDVTMWIDLKQAQQMLGLENLIHAILALECECAGDRISVVRALMRLVFDHLEMGDVAAADTAIDEYDAVSRAVDLPAFRWRAPLLRSMRAIMDGRFDESEALSAFEHLWLFVAGAALASGAIGAFIPRPALATRVELDRLAPELVVPDVDLPLAPVRSES